MIINYLLLATASQSISASNTDADVETRLDIIVKNPEIILLEDQHNSNSNCLVLDVSFIQYFQYTLCQLFILKLALQMRMITIGVDTKLYGWLKNLTVYSSNFAELRDTNDAGSKIKYRVSWIMFHSYNICMFKI